MKRVTLIEDYFAPGVAWVKGRTVSVSDDLAKELIERQFGRDPLPEDADEVKRIAAEQAIADETAETAEDAPNGETGDDGSKKKRR